MGNFQLPELAGREQQNRAAARPLVLPQGLEISIRIFSLGILMFVSSFGFGSVFLFAPDK